MRFLLFHFISRLRRALLRRLALAELHAQHTDSVYLLVRNTPNAAPRTPMFLLEITATDAKRLVARACVGCPARNPHGRN